MHLGPAKVIISLPTAGVCVDKDTIRRIDGSQMPWKYTINNRASNRWLIKVNNMWIQICVKFILREMVQ